jgi:integrase
LPKSELGEVERWERNLANGSPVYAQVSARRLRAFLREMEVSAEDLVALEPRRLRNLIEDYLAIEKKRGHAGSYVRTTLKAIRSWLIHNDKEFPKGIKVPNDRLHPRIEAEQTPSTEDLRRVLLAANPYERVAIALVAFSGLRLQSLGNHLGDDGLTIADLPELKVEGHRVSFEKAPMIVRVRAASSKSGREFFTFLGPEGCRYLKDNLEARLRDGEKLSAETDLVAPSRAHKRFMATINVGDRIRKPMRKAGVAARPYAWRSYFIQKCLEAQSARGVPDRFIEFWVGHSGDVSDRHYGTGKAHVPAALVEEMRTAYTRCCEFLETPLSERQADLTAELKRALLAVAEVPEKDRARFANAPNEEIIRVVRERLLQGKVEFLSAPQNGLGSSAGDGANRAQRPVNLVDAERLLREGWTFVANFGPDRVILQPP